VSLAIENDGGDAADVDLVFDNVTICDHLGGDGFGVGEGGDGGNFGFGIAEVDEPRLEQLLGRGGVDMLVKDSLEDDVVAAILGEDFFENLEGVVTERHGWIGSGRAMSGGGQDETNNDVGISELEGAVGILDGERHHEGLVVGKEAAGNLVFERLEADNAAGVENVDGGWSGCIGLDGGETVEREIRGVPGAEFVGNGGENLAPVGKPATDGLYGIFRLFLVDAADFGADDAGGRAHDVAGA